jgi:hypothetical protein
VQDGTDRDTEAEATDNEQQESVQETQVSSKVAQKRLFINKMNVVCRNAWGRDCMYLRSQHCISSSGSTAAAPT